MHNFRTFGARTRHGQPWTHKIHHDLDLGETTNFPLVVYFVPLHEAHIQTALWESRNFQSWDFCNFEAP
jgi:hypothetical protein